MTLSNLTIAPRLQAPPSPEPPAVSLRSPRDTTGSLTHDRLLELLRPLARRDLSGVVPPALWRSFWGRVRFPEPHEDLAGCWTWQAGRKARDGEPGNVSRAPTSLFTSIPRASSARTPVRAGAPLHASVATGAGTAPVVSVHARRVAYEFLGWGSTARIGLTTERARCGNERCLRPDHAAVHERKRERVPGVLELLGIELLDVLEVAEAPSAPEPPAKAPETAPEVPVQLVEFRSGGCIAFTPHGVVSGPSMLSVCAEVEARRAERERAS